MAKGVEVKAEMRIRGMKVKHMIMWLMGIMFLTPPGTPVGILLLIVTYKAMKSDMELQVHQKTMEQRAKMPTHDEDGVEYEEVDVAYPNAEDEFDDKEFIRNLKRWR